MGSTIRSTAPPILVQTASETIRWRSWPLVDQAGWSWIVVVGIALVGWFVHWMGGSWFLAAIIVAALAIILWQFLAPVSFELTPLGLRRCAFGRVRLIAWQAIRAYQLRTTGIIFFQSSTPTTSDVLRSLFVPYPSDEDDFVLAVRVYLPHASELTE